LVLVYLEFLDWNTRLAEAVLRFEVEVQNVERQNVEIQNVKTQNVERQNVKKY
jgi:FKBP-type peptidyl-prolyl cis-trans isomerase 2